MSVPEDGAVFLGHNQKSFPARHEHRLENSEMRLLTVPNGKSRAGGEDRISMQLRINDSRCIRSDIEISCRNVDVAVAIAC